MEIKDNRALEGLISDLRQAANSSRTNATIRDIVAEFVKDPAYALAQVPYYQENDVILFEDDTISIWYCRFDPGVVGPAHDHQMQATIGVYDGAERNDFYERTANGDLTKSREVVLDAGNVLQIGPSDIHAVACASDRPSQAIHVYLGALTRIDRSLFDAESGEEMQFSDENYNKLTKADH